MSASIDSLLREWTGLGVVTHYHARCDAWIFIVLHDDRLGTATGGTRLKGYSTPADGLRDGMRLARGMTHKWAALEFDLGGGKAVLALSRPLDAAERRDLLLTYGGLIESLRGSFATGRDLGTTDADMRTLAEATRYVHGVDRATGATRDPGPYTASGVLAALRSGLRAAFGAPDLAGRHILIQGVGDVGAPLARSAAAAGAELSLCDIDEPRAHELARELGARVIPAERAIETECDVYAPCAVGATVNADNVPRLRCRAVVGSANNQLGDDSDADRLHERGILYAPDFIANGGGALAFGLIHRGVTDEREIARRLAGIETTLDQVFEEARAAEESPLRVALHRVERTLASPGRGAPDAANRGGGVVDG
jgi:leucine dehydrogenase